MALGGERLGADPRRGRSVRSDGPRGRKLRKSQILTFLTQNFIHFSWILGHFEHFHFSGGSKLARFASVWDEVDFGKNGKKSEMCQNEPNLTFSES